MKCGGHDGRDAYGGDRRLSFEKSGFFHLADADRWWFVTPAGHAFLSWGINHVGPGILRRPYNAEFWQALFGGVAGPEGSAWREGFQRRVRADMAAFGFNTLGVHSGVQPCGKPFCAYVQGLRFVEICHWQTPGEAAFIDVFAPDFEAHCDGIAAERAASRREDPFLLGYAFTDCPVLTDLDAAARGVCIYGNARQALPTWPRVLRNAAGSTPGKQAYVETVRELYRDEIDAFNATYRTAFDGFDALLGAEGWRPAVDPGNVTERRDNARFLERVVRRYYEVAVGAVRRYDPNHLVFGDKLNLNTGVPIELVRIIGKHTDLLFYQCYGHYEQQEPALDTWSAATGKPLFNGDSSFSVPDENMPVPLGPKLPDQQARAEAFTRYATAAFSRRDYVGWNWCGWVDSCVVSQPGRQHTGIQTAFGEHYAPLRAAMHAFSERMYDVARTGG